MNDRVFAFVTSVLAAGILGSLVRDQPTPLPRNERDVQLIVQTTFKGNAGVLGMSAGGGGASCFGVYPKPKKVASRGCAARRYAYGRVGHPRIGGRGKERTQEQETFVPAALFAEEKPEFIPAMFNVGEDAKPCPSDDMRSVCIARRAKMTKIVRRNQRALSACYEDHLVKPTTVTAKVSTYANGQKSIRLHSEIGDQNCWKRIAKDWDIPKFETDTHANVSIHLRLL